MCCCEENRKIVTLHLKTKASEVRAMPAGRFRTMRTKSEVNLQIGVLDVKPLGSNGTKDKLRRLFGSRLKEN